MAGNLGFFEPIGRRSRPFRGGRWELAEGVGARSALLGRCRRWRRHIIRCRMPWKACGIQAIAPRRGQQPENRGGARSTGVGVPRDSGLAF